MRRALFALVLAVFTFAGAPAQAALDPALTAQLGADDTEAKVEAIRKLVATEDAQAITTLTALGEDRLILIDGGKRAAIVADGKLIDAASGTELGPAPANPDPIVINNRIRGELGAALAALKLGSPDRDTRLAAAREVHGSD
ncbi:MAG: urea ABC transporter permease subunit UrtB, partial [bacterium]